MTGYLLTHGGKRFRLPPLLSWRITYTGGVPCDSFRCRCPWGAELDAALSAAARFEAEEAGEIVFRGVVDEYECAWEPGGRLTLAGRGLAALLLDNEALPADYQLATAEDILRDHVRPYGVQVAEGGSLSAVAHFPVESGSSEWQVLRDFACYHGGVEPRFDREGRLYLTPWPDGARLVVDDKVPLTALAYREKRYGVLSEVLVRDRVRRTVERVADQDFIARGGACRRVLTMPGRSGWQAMRYRGEFQLEQSRRARRQVVLSAPSAFLLRPGDLVELRRARPRLEGLWRAGEVRVSCGEDGVETRVILGEV